jgi:hypothetical protein
MQVTFEVFTPVTEGYSLLGCDTSSLAKWFQMLLRPVVVVHLQDDPGDEDTLIPLIERCK